MPGNPYRHARGAVLSAAFFVLVFMLFLYGLGSVSRTAEAERIKSLRSAVSRAAVHCYAAEGFYPPTLSYLESAYGLQIDHEKYMIDYRCFASNIMPEITVLPRHMSPVGEGGAA
ncbi:MAG: hypothetical protein KBC20_04780 [Oscillospiraceae bacterium]|nr:hypothetical protein [Oscillospiraceae bacterium]